MVQLRDYQIKTLNKLIKYDNSFVFWPRQTGKSTLISAYIENFVINNSGKDILFICDSRRCIKYARNKIIDNLYYLVNNIKNSNKISFVNSNILTFFSFDFDLYYHLNFLKPELVIFDELYISDSTRDDVKITEFSYYMKNFNCKSIFISSRIDTRVIKSLDYRNQYYINIIPTNDKDLHLSENNNDYKIIINELSYKPDELLDYFDLNYQRKKKLKKLNKIADGK